jgi:hypothetical protein
MSLNLVVLIVLTSTIGDHFAQTGSGQTNSTQKTPLFEQFIYKNDPFTNTGSGQT